MFDEWEPQEERAKERELVGRVLTRREGKGKRIRPTNPHQKNR